MIPRRSLLSAGAASGALLVCTSVPCAARAKVPAISQADQEKNMRLAIAESAHTRNIPAAAVIVKPATGEVMARGINNSDYDPTRHSELACIGNYIERNGNSEWGECVIYTIAEPCTMCQSALVFCGIAGTVFGSPVQAIKVRTPRPLT
jgi:tRNA(adenine34) deaminase